jgi:hypothetical protein
MSWMTLPRRPRGLFLAMGLAIAAAAPAHAQPAPAASGANVAEWDDAWKQMPPLRPTPPTAHTLGLARRLIALERQDLADQDLARLGAGRLSAVLPANPALIEAMAQAAQESPDLLQAMRDRAAEVYARNYTDEELAFLIGLLSDPSGWALHQKRRAGRIGQATVYTPEEQAWIRRHEDTEMGRTVREKRFQVGATVGMANVVVFDELSRRTGVIYCARQTCTDAQKARLAAKP